VEINWDHRDILLIGRVPYCLSILNPTNFWVDQSFFVIGQKRQNTKTVGQSINKKIKRRLFEWKD